MATSNLNSGSNHNKPNALQKMNPMMWRQARTVKKAVGQLDGFVSTMTHDAPFFTKYSPNPSISLWQRSEVQTGKLLGEGSFCQVYEVSGLVASIHDMEPEDTARRDTMKDHVEEDRQAKAPARYAIKMPKRDMLRKPYDFGKAIADLVVEAEYLIRLDHPNILALRGLPVGGTEAFDSGRFDSYFLVLDRLSTSLEQRIIEWQKEGPPDPKMIPRKTNYALQIANALVYLHQKRIIFRDLKPENVGFLGEHHAQLFDFGLVRELPQSNHFDDEQYAMSGSGSQWYMAVEIFITGKYSLKADVYSWAITTYEMLTESKAFEKMHNLQHVALVCVQGKRPRLSSHKFPAKLESLLRHAWGQSVAQRPSSLEVVRALEKMLPDMGDEDACVWPTVEYVASSDFAENKVADNTDDDDSNKSIDAFETSMDAEIVRELKAATIKPPTYGDVEDFEYSLTSMMYADH
jgi:serine/threonine protein kinase